MAHRPKDWRVAEILGACASGRGIGKRSASGGRWPVLEALEARALLSVITYDGGPGGTGTDFHDAVNWAGDVLPGVNDDAVIPDLAGVSAVLITQSTALQSLTTGEGVVVGNASVLSLSATCQ